MADFEVLKAFFLPIGWTVNLSHDEVHKIARGTDLAAILSPIPEDVQAVLLAGASGLEGVCALGGHNGVHIHHVAFVTVPTPRGGPPSPPLPIQEHPHSGVK